MATANPSGFSGGSIKESMSRKLSEYHAITKELIDSILLSYTTKAPNTNLPEPHIVMQKLLDKDKEFQKLLEECKHFLYKNEYCSGRAPKIPTKNSGYFKANRRKGQGDSRYGISTTKSRNNATRNSR